MAKTNIKPLGEYVLIEPKKAETKTESGIYIPDTASEKKTQFGKVVAAGESEKMNVKKGQQVVFRQYSGEEIADGGKDYLLIKCDDIIAVIES